MCYSTVMEGVGDSEPSRPALCQTTMSVQCGDDVADLRHLLFNVEEKSYLLVSRQQGDSHWSHMLHKNLHVSAHLGSSVYAHKGYQPCFLLFHRPHQLTISLAEDAFRYTLV